MGIGMLRRNLSAPGCRSWKGDADRAARWIPWARTNRQRHDLAPKRKNTARTPKLSGPSTAASVAPNTPAWDSASFTQSRRVRFGDKVLACLLADAQLPDHIAVAVRVVGLQVIQQATALAHQHQ